MIRSNRYNLRALAGGALLLGLMTAAPGQAAEPQKVHKVELRSGTKVVTIEQRLVPAASGIDVQLIARGPVSGTKTVAVMYANGELAVKVDKTWWKGFFTANGLTGDAEIIPRKDNGRLLADLAVTGAGGSAHLIGVAMFDPDQPWGPCPGPDDAPGRCPEPQPWVVPFWCKYDVDQCSGGPLPGPAVSNIDPDGEPALAYPGIDPDGDPALQEPDPEGSPAHGLAILRVSLDAAKLVNGTLELGTIALPLDGSRWFDFRGPGF